MKIFEYRIIDHDIHDSDEISLINGMGERGWEIISVINPIKYPNSDGMYCKVFYKREKQEK